MVCITNPKIIDLIIQFSDQSGQTEMLFSFLIDEGAENSNEVKKEKSEDEHKYLQKHKLKIRNSSTLGHYDYNTQTSRLVSLSYKEALIQPPDFI